MSERYILSYLSKSFISNSWLSFYGGIPGAIWLSHLLNNPELAVQNKIIQMRTNLTKNFTTDKNPRPYELADGWVGIGLFFFHEGLQKNRKNIEKIIGKLAQLRIQTSVGELWVSDKNGKPVIDLGLPHGLLGVLLFFSLCFKHGLKKKLVMKMVEPIVQLFFYVYSTDKAIPSLLPSQRTQVQRRLAWCYGDLIAGYALTVAGIRFEKKDWELFGKQIFMNTVSLKGIQKELQDPFLCHGIAGTAQICLRFYELTSIREVMELRKKLLSRLRKMRAKPLPQACPKNLFWFYNKMAVSLALGENHRWDSFLMLSDPITHTAA